VHSRLNAYTLKHTDAFSFSVNQAALANTNAFTVGLYGERRFMLQELSWYQSAIVLPTTSGNFGFKSTYFGNSENSELELGLAYGRKLGTKVSIGTQFNYYSQKIPYYGAYSIINAEGGLLLLLSEQIQVGFHLFHPVGISFAKSEEKLPLIYTIGLGYEISNTLNMGVEMQKVENGSVNVNANIDYSFDKRIFTRIGISTQNTIYSIGAGVLLNDIRLDINTSIHPHLGATPGISLLYQFKERHRE
jgi:hypothetical protein